MVTFTLTQAEMAEIQKSINGQGGHQTLMRKLRGQLNQQTGEITLTDADIGKIMRYADYSQGGFQDRFKKAFRRNLQPMIS